MPYVQNGTERYVFYVPTVKKNYSLHPVLLTDRFKHSMKINSDLNAQVFTVIWKSIT